MNLTTFWWSLPAVPLVLAAALRRRPATVALLAVPAVLWLWAYGTAFLPPGGGAPAARRADLRVATLNTYVRAPGPGQVLDLVEDTQPDVLLLQELFEPRVRRLEQRLGGTYPHREVVPSPGVGGVAVFSRHEIVETRPVGDPTARSRSTAVVVLDVTGTRIQVVPVHLLSPCPTCGTSVLGRSELEVDVRRAEVTAVLEALDPGRPAIVGGDLNSTARSEPYRRLAAAGFSDPQREAGSGLGATWPTHRGPGALLRIDWILTRGLRPAAAWVGPPGASDHRPVIVDVNLP